MNERLSALRIVAVTYIARVRQFSPNARLYLLHVILSGAAMGVFRLLFNFYGQSLGLNKEVLGQFVSINNLVALLAALPIGYFADRFGRKNSLVTSALLVTFSMASMVLFPQLEFLYLINVVMGLAQSLAGVTMSPFLMENSQQEERTYLFSMGQGLQMVSSSLGNWVGGYLPGWAAIYLIGGTTTIVSATSSPAYGAALLIISVAAGLAVIPLFFLKRKAPGEARMERAHFDPIGYARTDGATLVKLILPMLITSIGAGLIMPFMNLFFREVHSQPDPVIGIMFAWGSLAMGIGLILAPALADRMGKIQLVVLSQAISIPFLVILGFSPWFWLATVAYYIRLTLMNMSGPVYQTFVMEHVRPSARATVASLVNMAHNFGWALSPQVSGWLQEQYGFWAAFTGTIGLYIIATSLYWIFFWRRGDSASHSLAPVQGD
jgi:MFS family permease